MRRQNEQERGLRQAMASIDGFVATQTALRQNIVSARVGIVQDYDDTVQLSNQLERALAQLEADFRFLPDQAAPLKRVARAVVEQLGLIEDFKSRNAILRNALAAFSLLSAHLNPADLSRNQQIAVTRLGSAILDLTLNTAPDVVSRVDQQLGIVAAIPSIDKTDWPSLIRQAMAIRDGLPAMDTVLRTLSSTPDDNDLNGLRDAVIDRQATVQAAAQRYRLALSSISGILALLLVRLGYMVRARARALRRRTGFEQFLADISGRLSEAAGAGIERQIGIVLGLLADITAADQICVALGSGMAAIHGWSRVGAAPEAGWAHEISSAMQQRAEASLMYVDGASLSQLTAERPLMQASQLRVLAAARRDNSKLLAIGWSRKPAGLARSEVGVLTVTLELLVQAHAKLLLAQDYARLDASMRQAKRMETLGSFASGIAHNFNNILSAILGHAEIEECTRREHGGETSNLEALQAAGQRGQDLVGSILAFGRRDISRPKLIDVQAILAETVSLLRTTWPSDVALHVDNSQAETLISGNATQLQQVMLNICRNASQAVGGGGDVYVSLEAVAVAEPVALSHALVPPGQYARFRVRDTGRGMDQETLNMMFEPFFTSRIGGTGLGLATAWEIVRDHGGFWNVSSAPGVGSILEVWLPLSIAELPLRSTHVASPLHGQGEAIMVVNLDRPSLLRDEEVIAAFGFEPTGFHDLAAALAACRTDPNRFSVIVICGPCFLTNSAHFVGKLHTSAPSVPILLAVSASAELDLDALSGAGLSDIVGYNASSGNLCRALVSWARRHAAHSLERT